MDVSSRERQYSTFIKLAPVGLISERHNSGRSGVQPENTPTAEEEGISSDGCTHEHNVRTDHVISSPMGHRRRNSPYPWWLGMPHHGRPDIAHDPIQHSSDTGAFYTAARSTLWDASCITQDLRSWNNIQSHDDGRMQQKQQKSSVAGCPRLLPSPHIQRANAVDHNDYAEVLEKVNEDVSGWLSSDSIMSTENNCEENEMIVALESPCRRLATQMSTPPPPQVSIPRTPSRSGPVKIPSTPCHSNGEDKNSPIRPHSHGAWKC
jgi:hypothetical protein